MTYATSHPFEQLSLCLEKTCPIKAKALKEIFGENKVLVYKAKEDVPLLTMYAGEVILPKDPLILPAGSLIPGTWRDDGYVELSQKNSRSFAPKRAGRS